MSITASRYHDISVGHRVFEHESKCAHLHGHNYRIHFTVEAERLDSVDRVMDFSVIKERLCMWLEENWDHKFLVFVKDPWMGMLVALDETVFGTIFNPTAENMAMYLVNHIGPRQLAGTGCVLIEVTIEETRKCSCTYKLERG